MVEELERDEEFRRVKNAVKEFEEALYTHKEVVKLFINGKYYSIIR